jgi:hypothetical protein
MNQKQPSNEQLALFVRRLRRTMNNERCCSFFGVANGEDDFAHQPIVQAFGDLTRDAKSEPRKQETARRPSASSECET